MHTELRRGWEIEPKGLQSKSGGNERSFIAKLSSSWLVKSSSAELRFALILVITLTQPNKLN